HERRCKQGHHRIANSFDDGPRMVLDNFSQPLKMLLDQGKRFEVPDPIIEGGGPFQVGEEKSHLFSLDAFRPVDVFIPEKITESLRAHESLGRKKGSKL